MQRANMVVHRVGPPCVLATELLSASSRQHMSHIGAAHGSTVKAHCNLHTQHCWGTLSVDACRGSAARETTWPCSLISRPCSSRRSGAGRKAFGFAGGAPGSPGCPGIPGSAGMLPKPGTAGRPAKFCVSAAAACCAAASTAGCAPDGGAAGTACAALCVGSPCAFSISNSRFVHAEQHIVAAN